MDGQETPFSATIADMGRSPHFRTSSHPSDAGTTVAIVEDNRDLRTTLARMIGAEPG